jgi:predicted permease
VGATSILPLQGSNGSYYWLPGEDIESDQQRKVTNWLDVTPGYLEAMDIPVLRGRGIENTDRANTRPVIVINEALAERHWPDEDPIGREIVFFSGAREIVGVFANADMTGSSIGPRPMVLFATLQDDDRSLGWVIEADVPLETLTETVRSEVRAIDPNIPAYTLRPLSAIIDDALGGDTIMAKIMTVIALIALVLAVGGVYGVMAYSVSQRRQEMGIRLALGAQNRDVIGMVMRQGSILAVLGVLVGGGVAFGMARGLSFFLFGVNAFEPMIYGAMALALLLAGIVATFFPARRATTVDPIEALRAE